MDPVEVVLRLGGVADARRLVRHSSRRQVRKAVASGRLVRDARGRYAVPGAGEARRAASALSGVVSGLSAAQAHGWEVKSPPKSPTVTVPSKRRVVPVRREGVDVRWRDVPPSDVWEGVLRPVATVVDCARTRPFDEALAVADSALRHGAVTTGALLRAAELSPPRGRGAAMRVAREASGLAANPFESVLRAVALDVPGLRLQPQLTISEGGWTGRPDLVDPVRRLVVEADSFGFHADRASLRRDCERYTALALLGWTVIRFSWEHVMFDPDYVRRCLVLSAGDRRTEEQVMVPKPRPWAPISKASPVGRYA